MRFSSRMPADLSPTELSSVLSAGGPAVDLTLSNPTLAGLVYDRDRILGALGRPEALGYDPQPLGRRQAREAVARYLGGVGRQVSPDRIALTASTSEGYSAVFKLLCDPGDTVAVPAPSYPLVPHLASLEALVTVPYRLEYDGRWRVDATSLEEALDGGARVVVVVSPNNPTGNALGAGEHALVARACAERGATLVVDEVFAPYGFDDRPVPAVVGDGGPLTFVLDGLSKSAALPQLKLGWVTVHGPEAEAAAAIARLEWLLDAYLSVGAPVQVAADELLATAPAMQRQLRARLRRNREALGRALAPVGGVRLLEADGGWYAVIELPRRTDEEALVTELATRYGVRVHPGFFYDFADEGYLVASLLVPEPQLEAGVAALARGLATL